MNFFSVLHVVSMLSVIIGISMASSIPVALYYEPSSTHWIGFLWSSLIPIVLGLIGSVTTFRKNRVYGIREGFCIVVFGWLFVAIWGAIPFCLVGKLFWYDAFFETVSGFTTTGASILSPFTILQDGSMLSQGIEGLPKSLLYWRGMTHWLGGMGIVILSMAILPFLGLGTHNLFRAEATGPTSDQLTPRIASSAKILWAVYLLLTIAQTFCLKWAGMDWFDSWIHACSTVATGGFSNYQASFGQFNSLIINSICSLFMFLAGINFILHLRLFQGKKLFYFKDDEFRCYVLFIGFATLLVFGTLYCEQIVIISTAANSILPTLENCASYAVFNVISVITTTGFCNADYSIWPILPCLVLFLLMFVGGCGGSTSGGIKQSRILILIRYGISQIEQCLFPHLKPNIRFNHARLEMEKVYKTISFFILYFFIYVAVTMILPILCMGDPVACEKMDLVTALSISVACLSNVGPGFGFIGPTYSFEWLTPVAKVLLSFTMILGRLELYTVLVLFLPSFWRR